MKNKSVNQFLLWIGAAISIAEIITGTLLAPLGLGRALLAIILGHLIGCFCFLLPASYIATRTKQTAIESTEASYGAAGVKLFSAINGLQLIGWTAVMIVYAAQAMHSISQHLFGRGTFAIMALIVAVFIIIWLLLNNNIFFKINNLVVIVLIIGVAIMIGVMFGGNAHITGHISGTMTFGSAVELNVTMALSWLPLIGDYTTETDKPLKWALLSAGGYGLGSLVMFTIGLLSVIVTGYSDFTTWLSQSNLGIIALIIVVFSTVTTTYLDAYSAATSLNNLFHLKKVNYLAVAVTVVGFVLALILSMNVYINFLYFIGSVFTPLYAIVFVNYWRSRRTLPKLVSFILWLLGIAAYYQLQKIDFLLGTTLLLGIILAIIVLVLQSVVKPKETLHS